MALNHWRDMEVGSVIENLVLSGFCGMVSMTLDGHRTL